MATVRKTVTCFFVVVVVFVFLVGFFGEYLMLHISSDLILIMMNHITNDSL